MSEGAPGLRERKKARTRETIVEAAMRLFAERGFEQTTIADIAEAADIAPRTFFGYFPSKEAVVFHDFDEQLAGVRTRLEDRRPGESAIDAMRAWIAEILEELDLTDKLERCRKRVVSSTPSLQEHHRALDARFEEVLATSVAVDLDLPADSLRPRMIAAAATAALNTLEHLYDDDAELDPAMLENPMAIVDEALTFLRGGIAALSAQPPPDARPRRRAAGRA